MVFVTTSDLMQREGTCRVGHGGTSKDMTDSNLLCCGGGSPSVTVTFVLECYPAALGWTVGRICGNWLEVGGDTLSTINWAPEFTLDGCHKKY